MFSFPRLSHPDANLAQTLQVLEQRRRLIALLGGAGLYTLLPGTAAACTLIPAETEGPYPGDGRNQQGGGTHPNVLTQSGILRSDIRSSFGSYGTTLAAGTLLTLRLQFVSTNNGQSCGPVEGLAIYLWHCNAAGGYSLYSNGVTNQNYLRGVQVTDSTGMVEFTTIFPGCYSGRWPHIHFEIFAGIGDATVGTNAGRISQLALPKSTCQTVYAQTAIYPGSTSNLNSISLATDNVFNDDQAVHQMATVTGSNAAGYVATLEVGINVNATTTPTTPDEDVVFGNGFEG